MSATQLSHRGETTMSVMEHEGYVAQIQFDDEAELFHGEVINLKDVITFQGKSVSELRKALRDSVKDYLAFCEKRGEEPEKPFSGKVLLRLTAELHRGIAIAAASEGKSLNTWAKEALERAAEAHL